jgi:hypothetical protein
LVVLKYDGSKFMVFGCLVPASGLGYVEENKNIGAIGQSECLRAPGIEEIDSLITNNLAFSHN